MPETTCVNKYIMEKKINAVDDFLGEVRGGEESNANSFIKDETKPFADMNLNGEEEVITEEGGTHKKEDDGEGKIPFHKLVKDPKLQRYIQKEIAKATQGMAPREVEKFKEDVLKEPSVVEAFRTIIGDDTPEKVNALRALGDTLKGYQTEIVSIKEQREAEAREEREAKEMLETGFENIEEEFDVDLTSSDPASRKARGEFIEFVKRVAPKNEFGEIKEFPDFIETYSLFQELKAKPSSTNNRAKELASRSLARSSDASQVKMPEDTSWRGVERFFSKLKG